VLTKVDQPKTAITPLFISVYINSVSPNWLRIKSIVYHDIMILNPAFGLIMSACPIVRYFIERH
jgi:hypothetical protein